MNLTEGRGEGGLTLEPERSMAVEKVRLRERMRAMLRALSPEVFERVGVVLAERTTSLSVFRRATHVAIYLPLRREISTWALIRGCWDRGQFVSVPAWDPKSGAYRMAALSPGQGLRKGPSGVLEPESPEWVDRSAIELWIVPGLAFTRDGVRLGRGAGWYDRLLEGAPGIRIGWAMESQVIDAIPEEPHDVRMDGVVTEQRIGVSGCRMGCDGRR